MAACLGFAVALLGPAAATARLPRLTVVSGAIAGQVSVASTTQTIDGITVSAVPAGRPGFEDLLTSPSTTLTGSDGSFRLEGVAPGPYFVSFAVPTSRTLAGGVWNEALLLVDDAPSADGAVTVTGGATINLHVTLQVGHLVSGTLRDGSGSGLPGVDLWLCRPGSGQCAPSGTGTDATGAFGLDLPPGSFNLQFVGPAGSLGFYRPSGNVLDPALAMPITIGTSDVTGLRATVPYPVGSFVRGGVAGLVKPGGLVRDAPLGFTGMPVVPSGLIDNWQLFAHGTSVAAGHTSMATLKLAAPVGLVDALTVLPSGGPPNHPYAPIWSQPFQLGAIPTTSSAIHLGGAWTSQPDAAAPGGKVVMLNAPGSSATTSFTGFTYAWLAFTGPHEGRARVYDDGKLAATVNLFSPTTHERTLVFTDGSSAEKPAHHTFKIVDAGGGPVSLEGLLYGGPAPGSSMVTLTVTKSGTGSGRVTGYGPISCGTECAAQRFSPSLLALSAVPDAGSVFVTWSYSGCGRDLTDRVCLGTLFRSVSIDARFDKKATGPPFVVTVTGSHHHNGPGDSTVFGCIATTPAQPSAPFSFTIDGPSGHASGTGMLDAMGDGMFQSPIFAYGTYTETVDVTGPAGTASGSAQYTVGAAQGTGTCP